MLNFAIATASLVLAPQKTSATRVPPTIICPVILVDQPALLLRESTQTTVYAFNVTPNAKFVLKNRQIAHNALPHPRMKPISLAVNV